MEAVFGWLGQLISYLSSWIPRPFLVNVTQRAVRFRRGNEPALLEPGLHWLDKRWRSALMEVALP